MSVENRKAVMQQRIKTERPKPKQASTPQAMEPVEAIMERIRSNLPSIYAPLKPTAPRQDLTLPHWSETALRELPDLSSEPVAAIASLLNRATPGMRRKLVLGPRAFDRWKGKFVTVDLDETERKAIAWIGRRAAQALQERDIARLRRSIQVLMMLPTSGDRITADSAEAWLMLLQDYPIWAAERACVEYAKRNKWRPTPAEIINGAEKAKHLIERFARNAEMLEARKESA